MKKIKKFFSSFLPFNWSISTQIVMIIILLFCSFFCLQSAISNRVFENYYVLKQKNYFDDLISETVDKIKNDEITIFDGIYNLNSQYGIFPILLDGNYNIYTQNTDYTIYLYNKTEKYIVPNTYYKYNIGDEINLKYQIDQNDHNIKRVCEITIKLNNNKTITNKYNQYDESLTIFQTGFQQIQNIITPTNLNNNLKSELIVDSINSLINSNIKLNNGKYIYTYEKTKNLSVIVILNQLNDLSYLASIIPVNESQDILETVSIYNTFVYMLISFVIIAVAIFIANYIATPIKELSFNANEVANQNFNIEKINCTNKETKELSENISKIAFNLSNQINKLNVQKKEIQELNFAQEEKYNVKKNLIAAMSHELKTPLFVIQTTINAIQDDLFTKAQQKEELENINQEITKANKMIEEILNIYSIDNKTLDLTFEPFDLLSLTKDLLKTFAGNYKTKKLQIHLIKNKEEIEIYANLNQFQRVISNIILNAMKYTPENNKIEIEVLDFDDKTIFSVANYGVNIPEKDLQFIFDAFYRVDKSGNKNNQMSGSGLGLYITKEILNSHQFPFKFENIENGVKFEIIIPK